VLRTVVAKLLVAVVADVRGVRRKDYQQLLVVRRLVFMRDLGCERDRWRADVREADGSRCLRHRLYG